MRRACIEGEKGHIIRLPIAIGGESYIRMSNDM